MCVWGVEAVPKEPGRKGSGSPDMRHPGLLWSQMQRLAMPLISRCLNFPSPRAPLAGTNTAPSAHTRSSKLCFGHPSYPPCHTPSRIPRPTASHLPLRGRRGGKTSESWLWRDGLGAQASPTRQSSPLPRQLDLILSRAETAGAAALRNSGLQGRGWGR